MLQMLTEAFQTYETITKPQENDKIGTLIGTAFESLFWLSCLVPKRVFFETTSSGQRNLILVP